MSNATVASFEKVEIINTDELFKVTKDWWFYFIFAGQTVQWNDVICADVLAMNWNNIPSTVTIY